MKKQIWAFLSIWILDSILLYLSAMVLPLYFVLGNQSISPVWAAAAAGLVWTFLEWIATPILNMIVKIEGEILNFGFYFLVNFVALWITARLAPVFGFGVSTFAWLAYLAIVADFLQLLIWKLCKFPKMNAKAKGRKK